MPRASRHRKGSSHWKYWDLRGKRFERLRRPRRRRRRARPARDGRRAVPSPPGAAHGREGPFPRRRPREINRPSAARAVDDLVGREGAAVRVHRQRRIREIAVRVRFFAREAGRVPRPGHALGDEDPRAKRRAVVVGGTEAPRGRDAAAAAFLRRLVVAADVEQDMRAARCRGHEARVVRKGRHEHRRRLVGPEGPRPRRRGDDLRIRPPRRETAPVGHLRDVEPVDAPVADDRAAPRTRPPLRRRPEETRRAVHEIQATAVGAAPAQIASAFARDAGAVERTRRDAGHGTTCREPGEGQELE